ncbi:hypothetical protein V493_06426 [Pseudogymnoascus sp. VKM F-4281 (FW-2241)]|nr:hypothetical protein V493_06426 [Pseudogymnoascus sp. VKM F-4281 (FW-2241)]
MLRTPITRAVGTAARSAVIARPVQSRAVHAISNPTLANIERRWEAMPPQEQADVWMALRDRMKTNWADLTLQEKKAAYWIAFGAHGPRAVAPPGEGWKVVGYTLAGIAVSFAIFAGARSFAKGPPATMTKEYQEASNEYLLVCSPPPFPNTPPSQRLLSLTTLPLDCPAEDLQAGDIVHIETLPSPTHHLLKEPSLTSHPPTGPELRPHQRSLLGRLQGPRNGPVPTGREEPYVAGFDPTALHALIGEQRPHPSSTRSALIGPLTEITYTRVAISRSGGFNGATAGRVKPDWVSYEALRVRCGNSIREVTILQRQHPGGEKMVLPAVLRSKTLSTSKPNLAE